MVGFHVLPWAFQEHCQSCSLEGVTLLNLANQSLWPSSWHNGWETCSSVWIDFTWVGHRLSNLQKLVPGPTLGYGAKVPQKCAPWWRIKEERKKVKLSRVRLFATLWTVAHQASPSMEFSRQEYRSGLPFPSPGDLPDPGIEQGYPALEADALTSEPPGKPDGLWSSP